LAAVQGMDFHDGLTSSSPLEAARKTVRAAVAKLEDDRYLAPDLEAATRLVSTGAVLIGAGELPGLETA
ncbi:MAG TPA: histidine ammonia-lyase, partial [Alphaproteobacteria bacterium]|nr:histidine ammonia-lyase [Alphaproteobacteria bacterium]